MRCGKIGAEGRTLTTLTTTTTIFRKEEFHIQSNSFIYHTGHSYKLSVPRSNLTAVRCSVLSTQIRTFWKLLSSNFESCYFRLYYKARNKCKLQLHCLVAHCYAQHLPENIPIEMPQQKKITNITIFVIVIEKDESKTVSVLKNCGIYRVIHVEINSNV